MPGRLSSIFVPTASRSDDRLRQIGTDGRHYRTSDDQFAQRPPKLEDLRDHAAHGSADYVSTADAQRVHSADGIRRQIVQAMGSADRHSCGRAGKGRKQVDRRGRTELAERPTSRLSKRTTRNPRCASVWQNASGRAIICVPSP